MLFLGYDLGSSSVKACLLDGETGRAVARAGYPDEEMEIAAPRPGWAEQDPETWWSCVRAVTSRLLEAVPASQRDVRAIGLAYQMHGLVVVGESGEVLRPSIIWCDSRAVDIGNEAFRALGERRCLEELLNSPGNFTASKLAWVARTEPALFARVHHIFLPGDYLAWRLTGTAATTLSGLSEGIFWNFRRHEVADFVLEHYGIPRALLPEIVPTFGEQGTMTESAAKSLGLEAGVPVTYRAGDQPNNALALNVLEPGEIAATAGTSGVVYGVSDTVRADPRSRVNAFAHVNHGRDRTRLGILLCINGTGAAHRWLRGLLGAPDYESLNREAAGAAIGSDGLRVHPFGNGAERMLENREPGARISHLDFNRHGAAHLARAVQEGIAFSFRYGMGVLGELGIRPRVVRAGAANLFQSSVFRETLTGVTDVSLELYETDGAEGAARGAALGAGFYASPAEASTGLERRGSVEPDRTRREEYRSAYDRWAEELRGMLTDASRG